MKSKLFDIKTDSTTGAVSSIVMCDDSYQMNWCGNGGQWGEIFAQVAWNKTFDEPFALTEFSEEMSVFENKQLRIAVSRTFDDEGCYVESYSFKNITESEMFFNKGDLGIYTPLCDEYHSAPVSLTQKCNAHIWCGENISWINALRQGNFDQNLGLVLTKGSVDAYSIDRENQTIKTARRGKIILHPEIISLFPDEEYVLEWKIFIHKNTEDFFERLTELDKNIDLRIENYTVIGDEKFEFDFVATGAEIKCDGETVPFEARDGRVFVKYMPKRLGEHIFRIKLDSLRTHISLFASPDFDELLDSRINYIVEKQQYRNSESALDGAYLVYDTKEERMYFNDRFHDHNAARERLGMGLLIARYLQTHKNQKYYDSLMKYVKFIKREILDTETGEVYNTIGKNPNKIRLYNAPWMMMFMTEMYYLTNDRDYMEIVVRIIRKYYEGGGCRFYPNAVDIEFLYRGLKAADISDAEDVKKLFVSHTEAMIETGLNYPPHEVIYEQTIVTPAVTFISEMGLILNDKSYVNKVEPHLEPLKRFNGMQPDYRMNGIPIRYWDDFWFGKAGLFADTLHYWSCLTAYSDYSYYRLSGDENYKKSAHNCMRNCLCLFGSDGTASCAYVQPYSVDGIRGEFYDDWANDQDFALYYAIKIFRK